MTLLLDSSGARGVLPASAVIALSLLPLLLLVGWPWAGLFLLGPAVDGVRQMLESSDLLNSFWAWLQGAGWGSSRPWWRR
jgi:hypothetical protein